MNQIFTVIKMLRPYWRFIIQSLCVGILLMLFQIPGPYITKILIDDVYPHKDFSLLTFVLILGMVMSLGVGGMNFLNGYFGQCVGVKLGYDFQTKFYKHIQTLDFSFFDNRQTGEILSRFRDMRQSVASVIGLINTLIINSLQLAIFPPILLFINWELALITLAVLPFDTLLVLVSRRFIRKYTKEIAERSAELSAKNYESISSIRTVQALGLETSFFEKIRGLFVSVANLRIRLALFKGGSGYVSVIIKTCGTLAYGFYGWSEVLSGNLTLGSYMAFTGYVGYLYGPIGRLIGLMRQIESTLVHADRFFEVYNLTPSIRNELHMPELENVDGDVVFRNVQFSYHPDRLVLHNLNLHIEAGQTVAIVGRSGSGKSTLAKLIPRFYDPVDGQVLLDGIDVRQYRLNSLRRNIGFVMQGSALFQGSILENLTFGKPVSMVDVENAARSAYIHDFVVRLPNGYDTVIGEQGSQLSEGQKQRVALARVLLQDTPILILDEPTAALDNESEFYIQEAMQEICKQRTVIVIAHRLSTIREADKIVVIEKGTVAEEGSHEILMMQDGVYAMLQERAARI